MILRSIGIRKPCGRSGFLLEAQNTGGVALVDEAGEESDEDIFFEEAVLFYNPAKSHVEEDAYLTAIPYEPKKACLVSF